MSDFNAATTIFDSIHRNCPEHLATGDGRSARLVRPFEKNLKLTIIGPTRTLKYKASTINDKIVGPTKVGVVGPTPPAL